MPCLSSSPQTSPTPWMRSPAQGEELEAWQRRQPQLTLLPHLHPSTTLSRLSIWTLDTQSTSPAPNKHPQLPQQAAAKGAGLRGLASPLLSPHCCAPALLTPQHKSKWQRVRLGVHTAPTSREAVYFFLLPGALQAPVAPTRAAPAQVAPTSTNWMSDSPEACAAASFSSRSWTESGTTSAASLRADCFFPAQG